MKIKQHPIPAGFARVKRGRRRPLVMKVVGGGEVWKCSDSYEAYDIQGRYLGWTTDLVQAKEMAWHGHVNRLEPVGDLCLWALWNEAVAAGEQVLEDAVTGKQYLTLDGRTVMEATDGDNGWEVELMSRGNLASIYVVQNYPTLLALRIADKPFKLE